MANQEHSSVGDKEREAFPTHVILDIPAESETIQWRISDNKGNIYDPSEWEVNYYMPAESGRTRRRRILHRVPPQVREKNKHFYEPSVVSIGPYHHGQPQLHWFEAFKDEVLTIMLNSDGGADKSMEVHLRSKILERVDEIRSFYGWLSKDKYNDEALVEMMVRDACLVLCYMEIMVGNEEKWVHVIQSIGELGFKLSVGDYLVLENQIPWWVIKLLISLKYDDDDKGRAFIREFFSCLTFGERSRLERVPWEEGTEEEPLHLLEAVRTTNLKEDDLEAVRTTNLKEDDLEAVRTTNLKEEINVNTNHHLVSSSCPTFKFRTWWPRKISAAERIKRPFRSATELKAKGIHFRPSSEYLNDVSFSSYFFGGVLCLPIQYVNTPTMAFYSNIIVLETSPGNTNRDYAVTSYVNLMKSLIENPKDAKLLQENGILFNELEDNEQIVRMFKEIDTHGLDDFYIFDDIKRRINKHCESKAKTWIAELINTYFRSPWTAIAFFAAALLLCLTLLQTYYTINPRNTGSN